MTALVQVGALQNSMFYHYFPSGESPLLKALSSSPQNMNTGSSVLQLSAMLLEILCTEWLQDQAPTIASCPLIECLEMTATNETELYALLPPLALL